MRRPTEFREQHRSNHPLHVPASRIPPERSDDEEAAQTPADNPSAAASDPISVAGATDRIFPSFPPQESGDEASTGPQSPRGHEHLGEQLTAALHERSSVPGEVAASNGELRITALPRGERCSVLPVDSTSRSEYYNRPRLTVTTRPRIVAAPMLDRRNWVQPFHALSFGFNANVRPERPPEVELNSLGESSVTPRRKCQPGPPRDEGKLTALVHFCWRMFCLRCSIADQTRVLALEEEERGYEPTDFLCERFFGDRTSFPRAFWTICICDLLTLGIPCGCFYHGFGTALYGCRLRYLVRCRYRIEGFVALDFLLMLLFPLFGVDQQGAEMLNNGLMEARQSFRYIL